MYIPIEPVLRFLDEEGLSASIRIKHENTQHWSININEPWEHDTKLRCGISALQDKFGNPYVAFNSFKAVANLGDEYKGDFFTFVKLVKEFDNYRQAKMYFVKNYMLKTTGDITDYLTATKQKTDKKIITPVEYTLPENFERLDFDNTNHRPYLKYLAIERAIPLRTIKRQRIYVDQDRKRVVFPVYEDNKLIYWATRSIVKSKMPWIHSEIIDTFPIWNLDNVNGESVMIFEAILDAIQVPNGVALLGAGKWANLIPKILNKSYHKIIVAMDGDRPGLLSRIAMANELSMHHKNVYIYNYYGIPRDKDGKIDFGAMAQQQIPFDVDERSIKWDLRANVLFKMKKVS